MSALLMALLLWVQLLQVQHVFGQAHHSSDQTHSQQVSSLEIACPVCEYLIHQQPRHTPLSGDMQIRPAEQTLHLIRFSAVLHPVAPYHACPGNKGPPILL